jgi:hypothetical protein
MIAVHEVFVEGTLEISLRPHSIETLHIGLVLAEQQVMLRLRIKVVRSERSMLCHDGSVGLRNERGPFARFGPRPGVTKPELRQDVDGSHLRSPVTDGNLRQDVVRSRFEVLHEDIPVAVAIQNTRIDQLVLVILEAAFSVLLNQPCVRVFVLWILVVRVGADSIPARKRAESPVIPAANTRLVTDRTPEGGSCRNPSPLWTVSKAIWSRR